MHMRTLGKLWPVSALTLGGGGLGGVWGATDRQEAVATARAAVDAGINLIDLAPMYGRGEAEEVIGAAFGGAPPEGVRFTTKCWLGNREPEETVARLERSLTESMQRTGLAHFDLMILHSNLVPDDYRFPGDPEGAAPTLSDRLGTPWDLYRQVVEPTLARFVSQGHIGGWGITGVGVPRTILGALRHTPRPDVVQVVANLLDSPGEMQRFDGPAMAREIQHAAREQGVGTMGIRAVQAGALCAQIDRDLPTDHPVARDRDRAAPFRALCRELDEDPARIAHRYALSMPEVDTVVLGVKNRRELADCVAGAAEGPLSADLIARIDALGLRGASPAP